MTLRFRSGSLRTLGAIFRAALLPVLHALGVQHATQNVVAHAGQILDAAAADHDHRMLLQVVALAGDIANDLEAVGQPHLGDLAQSRIRLLRRRRIDARADPALLRARLQMARLLAVGLRLPRLADQLANRRHVGPKLQFPRRPAVNRTESPIPAARPSRKPGKATRETNSALKPRMGLGRRRKAEDHGASTAIVRNRTGPVGPVWLVIGRIVSV